MLEHAINDFERIAYDGIIRGTNAQPHQVKKIAAHNVPCRMKTAAIGDCEYRCIGIGVGIGRLKISWIDLNVVTLKIFDRLIIRCHGPFFYVRGQLISILQNKIRSVRFMTPSLAWIFHWPRSDAHEIAYEFSTCVPWQPAWC